jgi:hypothetical protein
MSDILLKTYRKMQSGLVCPDGLKRQGFAVQVNRDMIGTGLKVPGARLPHGGMKG